VQARGHQVAAQLRRLSVGLDTLRTSAEQRLRLSVDAVNQLTARIAGLNDRIVAAEASGVTAGDLRDQRDLAIDELAGLSDIQVTLRGNGTVSIAVGNVALVDGPTWQSINPHSAGATWGLRTASGTSVQIAGGALAADTQLLNQDLTSARAELDNLASALVDTVNTAHRLGMNAAGATNIDFFDPLGTTASSIALSAAVRADAAAIAAATPGTDQVSGLPVYRAGANDVALEMARLRTRAAGPQVRGLSINGYFQEVISRIGMNTQSAADDEQVYATLAAEADARRQSLIGVSTDEELMRLIQYQNAYTAAARVVSTVDEMMQTLVDVKR
jgi:flagellar hook-associated protein 1 FlgK